MSIISQSQLNIVLSSPYATKPSTWTPLHSKTMKRIPESACSSEAIWQRRYWISPRNSDGQTTRRWEMPLKSSKLCHFLVNGRQWVPWLSSPAVVSMSRVLVRSSPSCVDGISLYINRGCGSRWCWISRDWWLFRELWNSVSISYSTSQYLW